VDSTGVDLKEPETAPLSARVRIVPRWGWCSRGG